MSYNYIYLNSNEIAIGIAWIEIYSILVLLIFVCLLYKNQTSKLFISILKWIVVIVKMVSQYNSGLEIDG